MFQQAQFAAPSQVIQQAAQSAQNNIRASASKMEDLAKTLALQRSSICLESLKYATVDRSLPGTYYCKNFLETFASYYVWKSIHSDSNRNITMLTKYINKQNDIEVVLDNMIDEMNNNKDNNNDNNIEYDVYNHIKSSYNLIIYYLIDGQYKRSFNLVKKTINYFILLIQLNSDENFKEICTLANNGGYLYELAILIELLGVSLHLKCNVTQAIYHYNLASNMFLVPINSNNGALGLELHSGH